MNYFPRKSLFILHILPLGTINVQLWRNYISFNVRISSKSCSIAGLCANYPDCAAIVPYMSFDSMGQLGVMTGIM